MKKLLKKFWSDEQGLELSEYAVMAALIIIAVIVAITAVSGGIAAAFNRLAEVITPAAGG